MIELKIKMKYFFLENLGQKWGAHYRCKNMVAPYSSSPYSNLFHTRDQFRGRQFFHRRGGGMV